MDWGSCSNVRCVTGVQEPIVSPDLVGGQTVPFAISNKVRDIMERYHSSCGPRKQHRVAQGYGMADACFAFDACLVSHGLLSVL